MYHIRLGMRELVKMVGECGIQEKGLESTPKTTCVNLSTITVTLSLCISSTQRNCRMSQSRLAMDTINNGFSMSALTEIRCTQNLNRISMILWSNLGPAWKQSLSKGPPALTDASQIILSLLVSLSWRITISVYCTLSGSNFFLHSFHLSIQIRVITISNLPAHNEA